MLPRAVTNALKRRSIQSARWSLLPDCTAYRLSDFCLTMGLSLPGWGIGGTRKGWRYGPVDVTRSDLELLKNGHKNIMKHLLIFLLGARRIRRSELCWMLCGIHITLERLMSPKCTNYKPPWQLECFPGRLMCRYLPLQLDGQHATGLKVYTSVYGTSSIVVHGRNSDYVVSPFDRRGSPTSFYFGHGEAVGTLGLGDNRPSSWQSWPVPSGNMHLFLAIGI
ncbi:hypothetical protein V8C37DRAFT_350856 [Trichoderma ceciliae]